MRKANKEIALNWFTEQAASTTAALLETLSQDAARQPGIPEGLVRSIHEQALQHVLQTLQTLQQDTKRHASQEPGAKTETPANANGGTYPELLKVLAQNGSSKAPPVKRKRRKRKAASGGEASPGTQEAPPPEPAAGPHSTPERGFRLE